MWRVPPRRLRRLTRAVLPLLVVAAVVSGCGGDEGSSSPTVRRVGSDYDTIQEAVDAARPGDLVLIAPGTYREQVKVSTPRIVIRGEDRNKVVLDGSDKLLNGISVTADQVAVENLTVQRYAINGVIFTGDYDNDDPQDGPVGWRASYVTAANNGLYGLYAFGTGPGRFDHNYASGHPDSGIYVGQCKKCGAVVIDNVVEHNAIGYENTNASGVVVARNVARGNRIGMAINSANTEVLAPQRGGAVVANLVVDNDDPDTPETKGGFGVGIAVAGGQDNRIERNVVRGHPFAGIVLIDQDGFWPLDNRVVDNRLSGNGNGIVLAAEQGGAPEVGSTCVEGNGTGPTRPSALADLLRCGRAGSADLPPSPLEQPSAPDGIPYSEVVRPGPQPQMPGAAEEKWTVPSRTPEKVDLDSLRAPAS